MLLKCFQCIAVDFDFIKTIPSEFQKLSFQDTKIESHCCERLGKLQRYLKFGLILKKNMNQITVTQLFALE